MENSWKNTKMLRKTRKRVKAWLQQRPNKTLLRVNRPGKCRCVAKSNSRITSAGTQKNSAPSHLRPFYFFPRAQFLPFDVIPSEALSVFSTISFFSAFRCFSHATPSTSCMRFNYYLFFKCSTLRQVYAKFNMNCWQKWLFVWK